eukprot:3728950-Rhodomonas_salina.3
MSDARARRVCPLAAKSLTCGFLEQGKGSSCINSQPRACASGTRWSERVSFRSACCLLPGRWRSEHEGEKAAGRPKSIVVLPAKRRAPRVTRRFTNAKGHAENLKRHATAKGMQNGGVEGF